eukprot:GHRQ01023633.1.p1 GENE.GHRQ01023633.1~~GHRQ01023633.1.p1  ORF type:complete len:207 (-),score=21.83 GHRQ01023633.1:429-1049(-)
MQLVHCVMNSANSVPYMYSEMMTTLLFNSQVSEYVRHVRGCCAPCCPLLTQTFVAGRLKARLTAADSSCRLFYCCAQAASKAYAANTSAAAAVGACLLLLGTLYTRVRARAARAAMLSASSTLPPSLSTSASTYTSQHVLPGTRHNAARSSPQPGSQHRNGFQGGQHVMQTACAECTWTCVPAIVSVATLRLRGLAGTCGCQAHTN